jgi:hypothetical protein
MIKIYSQNLTYIDLFPTIYIRILVMIDKQIEKVKYKNITSNKFQR